MTVVDTLRILRARWLATSAGVVVAAVLAGAVLVLTPPEYSANGVAVLIQSRHSAPDTGSNPLRKFAPSLGTTAQIVVRSVTATPIPRQSLPADGRYSVERVTSGDAVTGQPVQPFISVRAHARTPEGCATIVSMALTLARRNLVDQQRSVEGPAGARIQLRDVYISPPEHRTGATITLAVAVLVIGVWLTGWLVVRRPGRLRPPLPLADGSGRPDADEPRDPADRLGAGASRTR